jgi:hypothetical protein
LHPFHGKQACWLCSNPLHWPIKPEVGRQDVHFIAGQHKLITNIV